MSFGIEIAKRIKELRIAKSMTQEELANKLEVDVSYLGRIERGKNINLQVNTLEKIINALDEDYVTFFSFSSSKDRKVSIINQISLSNHQNELLDIIERIIEIDKNK